jgi:SAM-dependent methyltransferase
VPVLFGIGVSAEGAWERGTVPESPVAGSYAGADGRRPSSLVDARSFVDASRSNIARVYDYWLGGKDNFEADRAEAERMLLIFPGLRQLVRENREFIARAVGWTAGQGIGQFIDVGAGLPTSPATHQSARAVRPDARVAYVDNDPMVVSHARALLADGSNGVAAVQGDLRDPAGVLASPELLSVIDLGKPACLILAAVLHLMEADQAAVIAAEFIRALAPGSYVIITMARYDDPLLGDKIVHEYSAGTFYNHSRQEAATFFRGLELVPPGLANGSTWQPGIPESGMPLGDVYPLVGVGRKP